MYRSKTYEVGTLTPTVYGDAGRHIQAFKNAIKTPKSEHGSLEMKVAIYTCILMYFKSQYPTLV